MCEIQPKHKAFFRLEAFTSHDMTEGQFNEAVMSKLLFMELELNMDGRFRFHIHGEETTPIMTPEEKEAFDMFAEEVRERLDILGRSIEGITERLDGLDNRITATSDHAYDIQGELSEVKRGLQNDISDVERSVSSLKSEVSNVKRGY